MSQQNVVFSLMSLLLKKGSSGIVANSSFARLNGWDPAYMHQILRKLREDKLIISTEKGNNRRVALPMSIQSHRDWMIPYFKGDVPPKYGKYVELDNRTSKERIQLMRAKLLAGIKEAMRELEYHLKYDKTQSDIKDKRIAELEEKLGRALARLERKS